MNNSMNVNEFRQYYQTTNMQSPDFADKVPRDLNNPAGMHISDFLKQTEAKSRDSEKAVSLCRKVLSAIGMAGAVAGTVFLSAMTVPVWPILLITGGALACCAGVAYGFGQDDLANAFLGLGVGVAAGPVALGALAIRSLYYAGGWDK